MSIRRANAFSVMLLLEFKISKIFVIMERTELILSTFLNTERRLLILKTSLSEVLQGGELGLLVELIMFFL